MQRYHKKVFLSIFLFMLSGVSHSQVAEVGVLLQIASSTAMMAKETLDIIEVQKGLRENIASVNNTVMNHYYRVVRLERLVKDMKKLSKTRPHNWKELNSYLRRIKGNSCSIRSIYKKYADKIESEMEETESRTVEDINHSLRNAYRLEQMNFNMSSVSSTNDLLKQNNFNTNFIATNLAEMRNENYFYNQQILNSLEGARVREISNTCLIWQSNYLTVNGVKPNLSTCPLYKQDDIDSPSYTEHYSKEDIENLKKNKTYLQELCGE